MSCLHRKLIFDRSSLGIFVVRNMTLLFTALAPTVVATAAPRESIRELHVTVQFVLHTHSIICIARIQACAIKPILVEINI